MAQQFDYTNHILMLMAKTRKLLFNLLTYLSIKLSYVTLCNLILTILGYRSLF